MKEKEALAGLFLDLAPDSSLLDLHLLLGAGVFLVLVEQGGGALFPDDVLAPVVVDAQFLDTGVFLVPVERGGDALFPDDASAPVLSGAASIQTTLKLLPLLHRVGRLLPQ